MHNLFFLWLLLISFMLTSWSLASLWSFPPPNMSFPWKWRRSSLNFYSPPPIWGGRIKVGVNKNVTATKRRIFRKFTVPRNPLFARLSDPPQECPFYARRVPLNTLQFSKKSRFDPHFWSIFTFLKSRNPYK